MLFVTREFPRLGSFRHTISSMNPYVAYTTLRSVASISVRRKSITFRLNCLANALTVDDLPIYIPLSSLDLMRSLRTAITFMID